MAETDMPMSSNGFDPLAQYARLSERVENQGKDIIDLRSNMNTGFQSVNANIATLSNELRNNSRTPWPVIWSAIGVSFAILGFLGSQTVAPIKEALADTRSDVRMLADKAVSREEVDWRAARGAEDRQRMEESIKNIRADLVPRSEHSREWAGADQHFSDIQRQIDDLKQAQGSVYGARDFLLELRDRQDRIERQISKLPPQ